MTTPDDLDFRIHLRNEVIRAGLDDVLSNFPVEPTEDLSVQLEVFEYNREEDINDLQLRFGDVRLELEYPPFLCLSFGSVGLRQGLISLLYFVTCTGYVVVIVVVHFLMVCIHLPLLPYLHASVLIP